ncbi:MAG: DUF1062 domain-containing protein [Pseudomonadota bacterium]
MCNRKSVLWTITPHFPPRPILFCRNCNDKRPFQSSQKFRLNAQGKRLDAWLIYRCLSCGTRWNRPIIERGFLYKIPGDQLQALQSNDSGLANSIALDLHGLKRHTSQIVQSPEIAVKKDLLSGGPEPWNRLQIHLAVQGPATIRLDRLLATQLSLSRGQIQKWIKTTRLSLAGHGSRPFKRIAQDGSVVQLELDDSTDSRNLVRRAIGSVDNQE